MTRVARAEAGCCVVAARACAEKCGNDARKLICKVDSALWAAKVSHGVFQLMCGVLSPGIGSTDGLST
eukprot:1637656-Rhodomonas_salina.2